MANPKRPGDAPPPRRLLTRREVAELLGVPVSSTKRLPLPPPIRITQRTIRWDPADIEAWLAKRKHW